MKTSKCFHVEHLHQKKKKEVINYHCYHHPNNKIAKNRRNIYIWWVFKCWSADRRFLSVSAFMWSTRTRRKRRKALLIIVIIIIIIIIIVIKSPRIKEIYRYIVVVKVLWCWQTIPVCFSFYVEHPHQKKKKEGITHHCHHHHHHHSNKIAKNKRNI